MSGYWIQRTSAETEIETVWRQYLWALARNDTERAYSFVDKVDDFDTFDKFKKSLWLDGNHPWSLSVSNSTLQIVSVKPNFWLTNGHLKSSTGHNRLWWRNTSGLYTEVIFVKKDNHWMISGLPMAVAD